MTSILQPPANNDHGVILTIGFVSNADRVQCVLPMFTESSVLTKTDICMDAATSAALTLVPMMQNAMTSEVYVAFVQAEGMQDGTVPFREDFDSSIYPGALTGPTLPISAAALMVFYEDPRDIAPGDRMSVGKTFMPGANQAGFDGERFIPFYTALVEDIADLLQNGYSSIIDTGSKWYRGLAVPTPRATLQQVQRVTAQQVRAYVGTQKRRLIPH